MHSIKYDLVREPTNLKQISNLPWVFGILLIACAFGINYIAWELPLELYIFYVFEISGNLTYDLFTLGIIFTATGYTLELLGWRNGKLEIKDEGINITGSKNTYIQFEDILRFKYSGNKSIQIRTRFNPVYIKFKDRELKHKVFSILDKNTEGAMHPGY